MDEPTNGDFDYDVAGIGQVDGSNFHNDSQGKSFLRIQYPSNLENGEYFFWGHNNLAAQANNTADVPAGVTARFDRVWRVSETGEVGTLDLLFDLSGLPDFSSLPTCDAASSIRLLVDTNNDGLFADQTPISGATNVGGNVYRFANMGPINNNLPLYHRRSVHGCYRTGWCGRNKRHYQSQAMDGCRQRSGRPGETLCQTGWTSQGTPISPQEPQEISQPLSAARSTHNPL
ncbi:MAG: hypothetical protein WDN75_00835 [Bacteroidota bacterium]